MQILTDLIPLVAPWVPGAPNNMIELELRDALIEFCEDTEAWTETVTMDQVADQAEYEISLTNEASIQRVMEVLVKTNTSQDYDDLRRSPYPVEYYKLNADGDTIVFYNNNEPSQTITDGIQFKFALRPQDRTEELSGDLLDRYGRGIAKLARYKMMTVPKKPYYNPQEAQRYYDEYKNTRMTAIREKTTQNKNQGMQVQQLGGILG